MISVPNRRQRLNGNSGIAVFLVLCLIWSCTASRKVAGKPQPPSPPDAKEEKIRVYDPKTGTYILVPRDMVKVDTVTWTPDPSPPVVVDKPKEQGEVPVTPKKKDLYSVSLFMPFNVAHSSLFSEQQDPKLNRFIQYYAGIRMALEEMDSLHLPLTVHSFDVDDPSVPIEKLLNKPELAKSDVIIGPYEKEEIESVASFGLRKEIMVVSPWLPAFSNSEENPFFIQLSPGLNTHAQAILDFIRDEMPGKKVFVVARDNPAELNRIQLFTKSYPGLVEELIIKDISPDLVHTDLKALLDENAGTVFIMPYYAKSDEAFVNSFMRKLHAEKETREAIVFGLPQWMGYTNLNANYMESLALHLSISSFIDAAHPSYTAFRTGFLKRYHTIPDLHAFQGYDLMTWIGHTLTEKGQDGLIGFMDQPNYGLASGFDIRPVYKNEDSAGSEMKAPLFYENKRIRILRYFEQDFSLVR